MEEALKKTKAEIVEALKGIGYELVCGITVNENDGQYFITLSIKETKDE